MSKNWKFWTWPGQIRELTARLATANEVITRQRADLEKDRATLSTVSPDEVERRRRGAWRASL